MNLEISRIFQEIDQKKSWIFISMRKVLNGIGKISTTQRNKVNICGTGILF
jgi:hypothetical protein